MRVGVQFGMAGGTEHGPILSACHRASCVTGGSATSPLGWLWDANLKRVQQFVVGWADTRQGLCGIRHVNRIGQRWRGRLHDHRPQNALYIRWAKWARIGAIARSLTGRPLKKRGRQANMAAPTGQHLPEA